MSDNERQEDEPDPGSSGDQRSPDDPQSPPWASLSYGRVVLALLAVVTVAAVLVGASTSSAAFGAYNPAWDGATDLRSQATGVGAESEVVRSTGAYTDANPENAAAVILSPDSAYESSEVDRVEQFVRDGGTLVVGEDFGPHTNTLLASIGASARVDGRLLRDERNNYESPAIPVATDVSNDSLVAGIDQLTLNHGTIVEPNGAQVLVNSSSFSYLDGNRNSELDDEETLASHPVATSESVGDGRVVVVSDASFGINAMTERPANRAFVRALFTGHERVLLDYSHAERLPPLRLALLALRDTPALQVAAGTGLLGVLALVVWRPEFNIPVLGSDRNPEEDLDVTADRDRLVEYLQRRHPEWNRERITRIVESVLEDREER